MKKIILPILAVCTLGTATAQFNIGVSAGYGIGSPKEVLGTHVNTTASTTKNIYGTLGNGIQVNVTPGYMFGDYIGVELGLNGFFGSKTTIAHTETALGEAKTVRYSNQFRIAPALVVKTGGEKISGYARGGLLIPVLGVTKTEITNNTNPLALQEIAAKTSGKIALGFTGAIGLNVHLGSKLTFFAEAGANSLKIKANKSSITRMDVNGQDQLGNTPEYGKETVYVDELNGTSNNFGTNPTGSQVNTAKDELRVVSNYSNLFVQVGIKFTISK